MSAARSVNDKGRPREEAAIVVSGGDGTLFHLLRYLRPPLPPITIVPAGRGNALARDLSCFPGPVAADLMEVCVTPASGAPYTCLCGSSVAFGYPSVVTALAARFRWLRRYCYAAASALTVPRRQDMAIQYEDGAYEIRSLTGLLINNTRYVGGFVAFPNASCCDGMVEAMELRSGYVSQMAHHISSMSRLDVWMPARVRKVRSVAIRPAVPQDLMLDGEIVPGIAEVSVRVLAGALRCQTLSPVKRRSQ